MIFTFMNIGAAELLVLLLVLVLVVVALVDILGSQAKPLNKIFWVLVVILGNALGAGLYFLLGRKRMTK